MPNIILVTLEGAEKQIPLQVNIPIGAENDAIFYVKRAVSLAMKLQPFDVRLEHADPASGRVDHVKLPLHFFARKRDPPRQATLVARLRVCASFKTIYEIKLDPNDTVVDAKFLLSRITQVAAENIRVYANSAELQNDSAAAPLALGNPDFTRIQFCFRDKDGFESRRSVPNLRTVDESTGHFKQAWLESVKKFGSLNFLGVRTGPNRTYKFETYDQVNGHVQNIIAGLVSLGAKKGDRVGIWAINRPEWLMIDIACCVQGYISVPLYDTLGAKASEYVLQHSESKFLFAEGSKAERAKELQRKVKNLQHVFIFDADKARDMMSLKALEERGAQERKKGLKTDNPVFGSDLLTICYTSGTTGDPKGVMLTHGALRTAAEGVYEKATDEQTKPGKVFISYLPLAHIYARAFELGSLTVGHAIGYFGGDTVQLVDDVSALRPHMFPGVPRVWLRVFDRVNSQIQESNFIRRWIAAHAFSAKAALLADGKRSLTIWDKLVFSKIKEKFGGNLDLVCSGAAPLSAEVAKFLQIALNTDFFEGYGLTETCAFTCTTDKYDNVFGHIGTPLSTVEIKLVDIPEMDYLTTDKPNPRGEIWIRGKPVFSGYYKSQELTRESITPDGWFKTGDVGLWRKDGNLQIIDRKKNIFKLSQGEYIRPEHIENVYKDCKYVGNIFVYGDSFQPYLVAIVVPSYENLASWSKSNNLPSKPEELIKRPELMKLVMNGMKAAAEKGKLQGFEQVKKISFAVEDFTQENDLLTPSLKLKRHQAKLKFKAEIDKMYAAGAKL